ncbi:MAG: DUF2924 domain-containing protein [Emcibacteraceae bacterium]|nr:DUF2924 domain-containing protein [Emcibacteraceae bacterium]MDG1995556.1 DUF2924 domain-containing protein [Emcibacteraceae bacterium]
MNCEQNSGFNLKTIEVCDLKNVSRKALSLIWRKMYRTEPPKGISRRMFEHAAAYYIQSQQIGSLPQKTKLKLKRYSSSKPVNPRSADIPDRTILIREWNGTVHQVEAIDDKFMWKEQLYGSLSEIARLITGTRWSGPRFFGLRSSQ